MLGASIAALFAACGGDPFGLATAGDAGGSDGPGLDGPGLDGSGDGTAGGDAADAGHDAPGADAPSEHATNDGPTPHDGPSGDAIVGVDAVTIETGAADAPSDSIVVGPAKIIFVTSNGQSGSLGGLAGADAICQQLATNAHLAGTYMAWLSSSSSPVVKRLSHGTGPYTLMNGTVIAAGWTGLTSGTLLSPINVNEKGGPPPTVSSACGATNPSIVWTGTNADGSLASMNGTCADWTTSGPSGGGVLGLADRVDQSWSDGCASIGSGSTICGANAALYCVEQ
jgi:hypothetical protein